MNINKLRSRALNTFDVWVGVLKKHAGMKKMADGNTRVKSRAFIPESSSRLFCAVCLKTYQTSTRPLKITHYSYGSRMRGQMLAKSLKSI